jgi:hypothetical protein
MQVTYRDLLIRLEYGHSREIISTQSWQRQQEYRAITPGIIQQFSSHSLEDIQLQQELMSLSLLTEELEAQPIMQV